MAYNKNIPKATDQISQSQSDLLANFQALESLISLNHVNFGESGEGKHKVLQLPVQSTNLGSTNGSGNFSGTAPSVTYAIGQYFTIGFVRYTIASLASGAQPLTVSTGASTGTFDASTGAVVISNASLANTAVYFVPHTVGSTDNNLYTVHGYNSGAPSLVLRGNGGTLRFIGEKGQNTTVSGGWTHLPSGIVLKWGNAKGITASGSPTPSATISFPTTTGASGSPGINKAIPAFGTLYTVVPVVQYTVSTTFNNNLFYSVSGANAANFTMSFSKTGTYDIRYLAIGV